MMDRRVATDGHLRKRANDMDLTTITRERRKYFRHWQRQRNVEALFRDQGWRILYDQHGLANDGDGPIMNVVSLGDDEYVGDYTDQVDAFLIDGIGTASGLIDHVRAMTNVLMLHWLHRN